MLTSEKTAAFQLLYIIIVLLKTLWTKLLYWSRLESKVLVCTDHLGSPNDWRKAENLKFNFFRCCKYLRDGCLGEWGSLLCL